MPKERIILPDAMTEDLAIIIKACGTLRPTYEIRMLAYLAKSTGRTALISVPEECQVDPRVEAFAKNHGIQIHRAE